MEHGAEEGQAREYDEAVYELAHMAEGFLGELRAGELKAAVKRL